MHEYAERWELEVGAPFQPGGETAWVAPVRASSGEELVLKIGRAHPEGVHEALALRIWEGDGAVRLHRDDVHADSTVLLMERCIPGTALRELPELQQDEVLADVLLRTWLRSVPAGLPLRPLIDLCSLWADETEQQAATSPDLVDAGLVVAALDILRGRPPAVARPDDVLLVTDLHAGNVLAAHREPWLLIDPKPYLGEPAYDVVQHLLNCPRRLVRDPLGLTERMAGLAGLDVADVRTWTFARCVTEVWRSPHLLRVVEELAPGRRR